jgi:hypothetical protein
MSCLNVVHIIGVGGGWRGHFSLDLALHLPLNRSGGKYFPSMDASSAIVITLIHFRQKFATWSCRRDTFGSMHNTSMMDLSCRLWRFGVQIPSMAIFPCSALRRDLRWEINPSSRYGTGVQLSMIGSTSPESSCAWDSKILKSWAISWFHCSCRRNSVIPFWSCIVSIDGYDSPPNSSGAMAIILGVLRLKPNFGKNALSMAIDSCLSCFLLNLVSPNGYVICGRALVISPSHASTAFRVVVATFAPIACACPSRFLNSNFWSAVGQRRNPRLGFGWVAGRRSILCEYPRWSVRKTTYRAPHLVSLLGMMP